jgi:hypothetical protein
VTRLRSPIKQRGAHAEKWGRWQDRNRRLVAGRANWQCEGCGSRMRPLEWAHLATRGNVISEPWCSTPELTAALCSSGYGEIGCHQKIDRNIAKQLLKDLRTDALIRLCETYGLGISEIVGEREDPLDAIREAVRRLDAAGWEYAADRNQVVKA